MDDKEVEQIRSSQYGNVPSKFDYKKRLSEVKRMSRPDRIELGKELVEELEAKNILVNDNLRNDLEHGVPKAIVNAEKKLANVGANDEAEQEVKPADEATPAIAKNEPAENVPEQDKQEVKTEAEKPAEEGNKKATDEGGVRSEKQNIHDGLKAIEKVESTHKDVVNAMNVDGIGNIDIVWGTPGKGAKFKGGYGLSQILAKRNDDYEKGRSTVDGKTTANKLIEVIAKGKNRKIQNAANGNNGIARMKINYDGYTAVLSMAQGEKNTWLLTGWEDDTTKKEAPVNASSEGYDSATATAGIPTLTRHTGETSTSSTPNISHEQKASKGNLEQSSSQHFDITDYTHTKTGEVYSAAKINGKVDRDTYAKIKDIATKHGGRYNRFAKRFFFKDTGADGRNAFVAEAEREVFGEETKQEEKTTATQNEKVTETKVQDSNSEAKNTNDESNDENDFHGFLDDKTHFQTALFKKLLLADDRMPTPAEQKVLAEYNGWGGLKDAFREGTKENNELKELLSDSEYKAAKASTLDAFYTAPSIVRAIWKGVSRLGFNGGRVLDPAMGIGNFYGCMPRDMMSKSKLYGVEMDELSSQFSKMLYPSAMVENKPFQSAKVADNFFDLVITNVPFSQAKAGGYMIYNFYFANGIDKVRPGGLMVYITSQGSLTGSTDAAKMRNYLAGRADKDVLQIC